MKAKIIFSIILFISIVGFIINKPAVEINISSPVMNPPQDIPDNEFLIAATQSGIDVNYSVYPDIGANAWHIYCGPTGGWPDVPNDRFDVSYTVYDQDLIAKINNNRSHGFRSIFERPKSAYLLYGQRSDYQCEDSINVDEDYWFYSYRESSAGTDIQDNSAFGNEQWVKFCDSGDAPGYVVKNLRANREQARKQPGFVFSDDAYEWYVMPRIRIDPNVLTLNPNTKVCAIVIKNWDGDLVDSVSIIAENFRRNLLSGYDGKYLEEYYFVPDQDPEAITIDTAEICPGAVKNYTDWSNTDSTNTIKTDFRVYWYGQCDMWIDYVRVENRPAHQLFKGQWDAEVGGEVNLSLTGYDQNNPVPNNFYMEEFEFNAMPCMKYINKIISDSSGGKIGLMANLNYNMFRYVVPPVNGVVEEFTAERVKRYLVDDVRLKYIVNVAYYLGGWRGDEHGVVFSSPSIPPPKSYHPVTLSDQDYDHELGILSYKSSVKYYEQHLQRALDLVYATDDGFISVMKRTDAISKMAPEIKIINLMQAHLWWGDNLAKLKEPSNEELSLLANLAVSYGAKGIMYFAYNSVNNNFTSGFYVRGLVETNLTPRHESVYLQDKWNAVKKINGKLAKWGPYLVNFSNEDRQSYIYREQAERNQLISETYFNDLKTSPHDPDYPQTPIPTPDIADSTFVQVATFKNQGEQFNRYFMIIN